MRVLVAEDEPQILSFMKKGLEESGFTVDSTARGDEALVMATSQRYDAIILDIMLPGRDGLSVLRQIRNQKLTTPIIVVTARSALEERLEGLNLGADDYLTKPFYVEELIARIHALVRRASGKEASLLQEGPLWVNLLTREVRLEDQAIELTGREFKLLTYLMRTPARVYTRTQMLEHVWGYDFDPSTNMVDVHIQRLRKKLDPENRERFIETVRGVGYRFRKAETA